MKKDEKDLEVTLRLLVRKELSKCSESVTPRFCEMIKTREGYLKAESLIIDFAIKNQLSISASIAQLEVELE